MKETQTWEEDMTEFLDTDSGQIACEVTGLTAAAEEVITARPELVWDLVADVTRVGEWSRREGAGPGR
jgi:ABC-type nitrate/sulfonate/bicarbonate transport system substrate-binding protein